MSSWLERADHTADDFEDSDFALPAEGVANERAAWRLRDGRAARSELSVEAEPVVSSLPPTHGKRGTLDA